jgi:hypothetical protein
MTKVNARMMSMRETWGEQPILQQLVSSSQRQRDRQRKQAFVSCSSSWVMKLQQGAPAANTAAQTESSCQSSCYKWPKKQTPPKKILHHLH